MKWFQKSQIVIAGIKDHYVTLIKKKTLAASKPAVKQIIEEEIKRMNRDQDSESEAVN